MIALLPWLDTAAARKHAGEFAVFFTPLFCNAYAGEKQTLCCFRVVHGVVLGSYTAMERAGLQERLC
jgi:hypothetical protein